VSGRFPAFVFGGGLGALLPVFHFHDVTREELEPKLRHLADNGYRSVISDEIAAYVRGDLKLPARAVGLCFDDAWRSVATVAAPLLEHYGLKAITYAIPARITEKDGKLQLAIGTTLDVPLDHWDGSVFTYNWVSENASPGTVSKATFDGDKLTLEYYDTFKKGTFLR